jgi:hypothetical protein
MVAFLSTLPAPQIMSIVREDQRAQNKSSLGPAQYRAMATDYIAKAQLQFTMTAAQTASFELFWRVTLDYGGEWFTAATWPRSAGFGDMFRFTGNPQYQLLARGFHQLNIAAEMRGRR